MWLYAVRQMLRADGAGGRPHAKLLLLTPPSCAAVCVCARARAASKVNEMPTPAVPTDLLQDESMPRPGADASALLSPHAASRSLGAGGETGEDSEGGADGGDLDLPLAGIYTLAEVLCLRRVRVRVCLRVLPPAPPLCSHGARCRTEAACCRYCRRKGSGVRSSGFRGGVVCYVFACCAVQCVCVLVCLQAQAAEEGKLRARQEKSKTKKKKKRGAEYWLEDAQAGLASAQYAPLPTSPRASLPCLSCLPPFLSSLCPMPAFRSAGSTEGAAE